MVLDYTEFKAASNITRPLIVWSILNDVSSGENPDFFMCVY